MALMTIQQRLQALCERTGLNAKELALRAGLSPNFVGSIKARKGERSGLHGHSAQALSYTYKVSQSWVSSGMGTIDAGDVATSPPPPRPGKHVGLDSHEDWIPTALSAIDLLRHSGDRREWAVMGAGERVQLDRGKPFNVYSLLAAADQFAIECTDAAERVRLDQLAREFWKKHGEKAKRAKKLRSTTSAPPKP